VIMKTMHYPTLEGGMNTQKNPLAMGASELQWVENLHWNNAQGWATEQSGYVQVNTTPLAGGSPVLSLYTFTDVTGVNRTLVQAGATLYYVTPLGGSILATLGQTYAQPNTYVPFMGWCFVLNSSTPPKRWNGASTTLQSVPGWPPVIAGVTVGNPGFGCVYANRLVLAGDEINPNTVYLSALEDPDMFTPGLLDDSAGAIQISPGDGQRITALMPLYIPYSNEHVLLIFKNQSIYALRGYDASSFRLELVSNTLGTETPQSLVAEY
jgi:hypothetical protein